jgi:hypothetical protein
VLLNLLAHLRQQCFSTQSCLLWLVFLLLMIWWTALLN